MRCGTIALVIPCYTKVHTLYLLQKILAFFNSIENLLLKKIQLQLFFNIHGHNKTGRVAWGNVGHMFGKIKKKTYFYKSFKEIFGAYDVHFNSGGNCLGPIQISQLEVGQKSI